MYWGNREKSRATFQGEWTKSGDKYVRNADGTYTYAGRSDDMMIVRGVNVFPTQIEELILRHPALAPHYLCVLQKQGPMDTLTVRVEVAPGQTPEAQAALEAAKALQHDIKTFVGSSAKIELQAEGGMERSMGKAKRVLDLRG